MMVPVLSNAIICIFPACSRDTAFLNKTPRLAPTPFPTMIATGVARPSAHGQLITSTEIALAREKPNECPVSTQAKKVITAIPITAGTKIPETRSATLAMGALVAAASDTI